MVKVVSHLTLGCFPREVIVVIRPLENFTVHTVTLTPPARLAIYL